MDLSKFPNVISDFMHLGFVASDCNQDNFFLSFLSFLSFFLSFSSLFFSFTHTLKCGLYLSGLLSFLERQCSSSKRIHMEEVDSLNECSRK